jgi:diguanylate cyclase (GGDEF)-like protein
MANSTQEQQWDMAASKAAAASTRTNENDTDPPYVDRLKTPVWIFDTDNSCVVWANQAALKVWSAESLAELKARDLRKDMSVSVAKRLKQYQEDFEKSGARFSELWTLYPHGEPRTLHVNYSGIRLADGRMAMFCEGLEQHSETPETLRSAEALLHATVMISLYSPDGSPLYRNPAARADVGSAHETLGSRFVDEADHHKIRSALTQRGEGRLVARIRSLDGIRWHEITARECRDAATGAPAILISEVDVSDLKETEEKAHFLALHDVLTGLLNRTYVQREFQALLDDAKARGEQIGLLFIDLDRFKTINDSLGHAAGDELLIESARRLRNAVRETDVVARVGGDEFLILMNNASDRARLDSVAERIRRELSRPVLVGNCELQVTPSTGISVFPDDGEDVETLMRSADLALYEAKDNGRNCHRYFSAAMKERAETRLETESSLRRALELKEFELFYQPRVAIADNRIVGAEALVRWRHSTRGLVGPTEFISICEETGLIEPLGAWVLESAARQQKAWQDRGYDIDVSINLSPRQFRNKALLPLIERITAETGCNPRRIELEITESMLMGNDKDIDETLRILNDLGFSICIDDFGTGYSNLSYIQRYPVKCLKIDRSFIADLDRNSALTKLIISMCDLINAKIVAEGVETEEQLDWLRKNNCHEFQGFLFSGAIAVDDFNVLLAATNAQPEPRYNMLAAS